MPPRTHSAGAAPSVMNIEEQIDAFAKQAREQPYIVEHEPEDKSFRHVDPKFFKLPTNRLFSRAPLTVGGTADHPTLIKGGMTVPQQVISDSQYYINIMKTGYGAGKSLIGCIVAIETTLNNQGVPFLMYHLHERFSNIFHKNELIECFMARKIPYKWDGRERMFTFRVLGRRGWSVGRIYCHSANPPEKIVWIFI